MVTKTIELGISLLRGGNIMVQKVNNMILDLYILSHFEGLFALVSHR